MRVYKPLLVALLGAVLLTGCGFMAPAPVDQGQPLHTYPAYVEPVNDFEGLTADQAGWMRVLLAEVGDELPKYDEGVVWTAIHAKGDRLYYRFDLTDAHFARNLQLLGMRQANAMFHHNALEAGANCFDTEDEREGMEMAGAVEFHADWVWEGRILAHMTVEFQGMCGTDGKARVYY